MEQVCWVAKSVKLLYRVQKSFVAPVCPEERIFIEDLGESGAYGSILMQLANREGNSAKFRCDSAVTEETACSDHKAEIYDPLKWGILFSFHFCK